MLSLLYIVGVSAQCSLSVMNCFSKQTSTAVHFSVPRAEFRKKTILWSEVSSHHGSQSGLHYTTEMKKTLCCAWHTLMQVQRTSSSGLLTLSTQPSYTYAFLTERMLLGNGIHHSCLDQVPATGKSCWPMEQAIPHHTTWVWAARGLGNRAPKFC